jgi:hypothetical protein
MDDLSIKDMMTAERPAQTTHAAMTKNPEKAVRDASKMITIKAAGLNINSVKILTGNRFTAISPAHTADNTHLFIE